MLCNPSCGTRRKTSLERRFSADRCAVIASLYLPQAALSDNARHSPSASCSILQIQKNSKHRRSDTCCFGRGRRDRSCFATPLAVPGEKLPWSVVFLPTAAPLLPRCICRRQRSAITPGTLRVPRVRFCTYKKQQAPQKRYLLFWQGQKGSNPRHSVLETDALPAELYPYILFLSAL